MIFGYLVLAHLIADFILQPTKLVKWKMKSVWGTLIHVSIHFTVNLILLLPIILNGYLWLILIILGICTIHFFIDLAKINYALRHDQKVHPFILDQLLHLLTILVADFFLSTHTFILPAKTFYQIYTNTNLIIFLSFLVVVTTVIDVFNFQKRRERNSKARLKFSSTQILTRIIVFTIIYSFFLLLTFFLPSLA